MNSPDRKPLAHPVLESEKAHLDLLQAELARLDLHLQRELLRWKKAGQDPLDAFRGLYITDREVDGLLGRPLAASWGSTALLSHEEMEGFSTALARVEEHISECLQRLTTLGEKPRLSHLKETFGLDQFDLDALLVCLAPTFDLRYERVYGYLQDDVTRRRPTVNLILNLLSPTGTDRLPSMLRFNPTAPLIAHSLLRPILDPGHLEGPLLSQALAVDEAVVSWILGKYEAHSVLQADAHLSRPQINEEDDLLAAANLAAIPTSEVDLPILALTGPDMAGQDAAARLWAARYGRLLLRVDLQAEIYKEAEVISTAIRMALRDGLLTGAIVYLKGIDHGLQGYNLKPDLAGLIADHPDQLLISSQQDWLPSGRLRSRRLFTLEFPIPDYAQRLVLWQNFSPDLPPSTLLALPELAGQFYLTPGQILDAIATARDGAAQHGRPVYRDDLFAAARAHSNPNLASLARQVQPRFQWSDMVLPADQRTLLGELIATVRGRPQVLDEWGVGQKLASSRGVTALFAGPPGTGKTMAAEIIAGELGLDLFKIDLSTIVSKYIGETEKNLERIFQEAGASNAILFFDEADALFGKRSEVRDSHDRYANIEISYLLQRMEAYDGVTILATNLRANLDEAFTRRLQFSVDFPFPEAPDRRRIWEALFPTSLPREAGLDLDALADRFKLAGGNIRNILVSAAYLAAADGGRVSMDHLLHGTRRELQKMGRLVNEADLDIPDIGSNEKAAELR